MGLYVCPADTVAAPPDIIWGLLTDPATYETWTDARVDSVEPAGPARPGQVVLQEHISVRPVEGGSRVQFG